MNDVDTRIRSAVVEIVAAAPPAPLYQQLQSAPPDASEAAHSRSRRGFAFAAVVVLLATGAGLWMATSIDSGSESETRVRTDPTPTDATPDTAVPFQIFAPTPPIGLTFAHPRVWTESRYSMRSSFSDLIVYLSNAPLHDPCTTTLTPQSLATTCRPPLEKLSPGQVLVSWSSVAIPHAGPEIPKLTTTIDGQPAEVRTDLTKECASLGGQESVTADIASTSSGHYEMVACFRGPNLSATDALVRRMLSSARITA